MFLSYLKECVSYDRQTGILTWKVRPASHFKSAGRYLTFKARFAGKQAGWVNNNKGNKYRMIQIDDKSFCQHTLIWLYIHGEMPKFQIDHISGDSLDNRPENLRDVHQKDNSRNRKIPNCNKSGVMGVHWRKQSNAWHAQIQSDGKKMHLGLFDSFDDAVKSRRDAEKKFNFHKNHGRKAEYQRLEDEQNE